MLSFHSIRKIYVRESFTGVPISTVILAFHHFLSLWRVFIPHPALRYSSQLLGGSFADAVTHFHCQTASALFLDELSQLLLNKGNGLLLDCVSYTVSYAVTHLVTAWYFNAGALRTLQTCAATSTGVQSNFNRWTYNESSSNLFSYLFKFVNLWWVWWKWQRRHWVRALVVTSSAFSAR